MKIINLSRKSDLQDPHERPKSIDINEEKRKQKKMKQDRRVSKIFFLKTIKIRKRKKGEKKKDENF